MDSLYIVHVQANRAPKQRRRTYRAHGRINRELIASYRPNVISRSHLRRCRGSCGVLAVGVPYPRFHEQGLLSALQGLGNPSFRLINGYPGGKIHNGGSHGISTSLLGLGGIEALLTEPKFSADPTRQVHATIDPDLALTRLLEGPYMAIYPTADSKPNIT